MSLSITVDYLEIIYSKFNRMTSQPWFNYRFRGRCGMIDNFYRCKKAPLPVCKNGRCVEISMVQTSSNFHTSASMKLKTTSYDVSNKNKLSLDTNSIANYTVKVRRDQGEVAPCPYRPRIIAHSLVLSFSQICLF